MGLNFEKSGKNLLPPTDGRIAIGKKNERGIPQKLDYFIFTHQVDPKTDVAPVNTEMTSVMQGLYGKTPKEIKVVLPFHHPDEVFYTSFADWKGRKEWSCKSEDGNIAYRRQQNGSLEEVPCNYEECKYRIDSRNPYGTTCKPNGILSVFILDAPVTGGVWKFRSNAWGSVSKIQKALQMMFSVRGSLQGLEVILSVHMEQQIVPDGKGGRQKQNVPVVEVKMPCSMRELAIGVGTVYGDFQEIRQMAKERGNLADRRVVQELANELSSPLSAEDDTDSSSEETAQNTTSTTEEKTQTSQSANKSEQQTSGDEDLF